MSRFSLPPPELRALWRRIPYGVVLPGGRAVDVRVDQRAHGVDAALASIAPGCRAWALVTAFNPDARAASSDENTRAHAELGAELAARGLPWLPSTGGRGDDDAWAPEPGYVVGGLDLVEAHALARRFGQAAFLYARAGAPVALICVRPAAFDAPRAIATVAWIDVDAAGRSRMVRPRGKELFFMPGGKKEPGEDDVAALSRELREELGVDVDEASVSACFVVEEQAFGPTEPTVVRMACYRARVHGEPVPSSEIEAQDFVAVDEPHRVPPAGRAVLANLQDEA